jgi:hypothetical protein
VAEGIADDGIGLGVEPQVPRLRSGPVIFNWSCSLSSESSERHLPTGIAEVLRLRAISRALCDRSAWRFAQDDGFVRG